MCLQKVFNFYNTTILRQMQCENFWSLKFGNLVVYSSCLNSNHIEIFFSAGNKIDETRDNKIMEMQYITKYIHNTRYSLKLVNYGVWAVCRPFRYQWNCERVSQQIEYFIFISYLKYFGLWPYGNRLDSRCIC